MTIVFTARTLDGSGLTPLSRPVPVTEDPRLASDGRFQGPLS